MDRTRSNPLARALAYPVLVGGSVAVLGWLLRIGARLKAPHVERALDAAASTSIVPGVFRLSVFLAQLVAVVLVSRAVGRVMRRIGQPQVVGEMLGGLLLGPSVLGLVTPAGYALLFPAGSVRFLNAVSQLGVLLFMFLVGLELDLEVLRGRRRAVIVTSHAGMAVPLCLGAALALALYPKLSNDGVSFTSFALFLGCALSVTAFPVLARLLAERGLSGTPFGALAIACAAVADVTAWCLLAVVLAVADAGNRGTYGRDLWITLAGVAVLVALMMTLGRRMIAAAVHSVSRPRHGGDNSFRLTSDMMAIVVVVALTCAWACELLGVHALLGAFIAGLAMPKATEFVTGISARLEELLGVVLLPLFFAVTGIRTSLATIDGGALWLVCALIIVVATIGKAGGTIAGARASGLSWRDAASLGALMNTRGLMELVILNVGLEIGIVSRPLFSMMVLMAIVTTAMTTPILALLRSGRARSTTGESMSARELAHARPA
jgi:Kef-type K+ transport system membrane component KefB